MTAPKQSIARLVVSPKRISPPPPPPPPTHTHTHTDRHCFCHSSHAKSLSPVRSPPPSSSIPAGRLFSGWDGDSLDKTSLSQLPGLATAPSLSSYHLPHGNQLPGFVQHVKVKQRWFCAETAVISNSSCFYCPPFLTLPFQAYWCVSYIRSKESAILLHYQRGDLLPHLLEYPTGVSGEFQASKWLGYMRQLEERFIHLTIT